MSVNINDLQYLQTIQQTEHHLWTSVTDRIIWLGYIQQQEINTLLKQYDFGEYVGYLKSRSKYISHITAISKQISSAKKRIDNRYPIIRRSDRKNVYNEADFLNFGDDIIHNYFRQHPRDSWGINWESLRDI